MAETDIESKIRALLAKATDVGSTEEERRTSAALAAKLAKEHGFVLAPSKKATPPAPPPVEKKVPDGDSVFEQLRRDAAAREAAKSPEQRAYEAEVRERAKFLSDMAMIGFKLGQAWASKR